MFFFANLFTKYEPIKISPHIQVKCLGLQSDLMDFETVANDLQQMQEDGVETDCEVKVGDKVLNNIIRYYHVFS